VDVRAGSDAVAVAVAVDMRAGSDAVTGVDAVVDARAAVPVVVVGICTRVGAIGIGDLSSHDLAAACKSLSSICSNGIVRE